MKLGMSICLSVYYVFLHFSSRKRYELASPRHRHADVKKRLKSRWALFGRGKLMVTDMKMFDVDDLIKKNLKFPI